MRRDVSIFPWWNHWPVAQIPCDGRNANYADRASHSCTTNQLEWADHEMTATSRTRIMLHGMSDRPPAELATLARSWLRPPDFVVDGPGYVDGGYDPTERAYRLQRETLEGHPPLMGRIAATASSPIDNLVLIIADWGEHDARLMFDGQSVPRGETFRFGHRRRIDGTDLIVFVARQVRAETRIALSPAAEQVLPARGEVHRAR